MNDYKRYNIMQNKSSKSLKAFFIGYKFKALPTYFCTENTVRNIPKPHECADAFLRSNLVEHLGLKIISFRDGTPSTKTNEELVIKRVFLLSNMFQYYNVHLECSNKTEDFFF